MAQGVKQVLREDSFIFWNDHVTATGHILDDEADEHHGEWILDSIHRTRDSQPGFASEVLKAVTAWADANQVKLYLSVAPSGALNREALTLWYERNGWRELYSSVMVRYPVRS